MADVRISTSDAPRREKQCDICSRRFARSEHLARHRRTHTKEKPFGCSFCQRSFQRADVRAAHIRVCPSAPQADSGRDESTHVAARKRIRIACDSCRRRKMRCDGTQPCHACQSAQSPDTCHYSTVTLTAAPSRVDSLSNETPSGAFLRGGIDPDRRSRSINIDHTGAEPDRFAPTEPLLIPPTQMATSSMQTNNLASLPLFHQEDPFTTSDTTMWLDDIWSMPMSTQGWLDDFDPFGYGLFDDVSHSVGHDLSSPMQTLTSQMESYFDQVSRPASPSLNKPNRMWYSHPPDFNKHDKDILRVFLGLFHKHIPKTFSLFQESEETLTAISAECVLAMAAVGGLFCSVAGSGEVARTMYNDARRLLMASFNMRIVDDNQSLAPTVRLMTTKTFLLLSLYGVCGSDKRSFEFVEAFQSHFSQSVRDYAVSLQVQPMQPGADIETARLLEALYIMDFQRVIIMNRPPSLVWRPLVSIALDAANGGELARCYSQAATLVGKKAENCFQHDRSNYTLASLASLATYLWPAMYPRQNQYGSDNIVVEGLLLTKADFVAVACHKWLQPHGEQLTPSEKDPSHLVAYHMMCLLLHANTTVLQTFAHTATTPHSRDPTRSVAAGEVHEWTQDQHYRSARWHAEQIMDIAEGAFQTGRSEDTRAIYRASATVTEYRRLPYESPHVPFSIYFAALVLWCGEVTRSNGESATRTRAPLVRAERILLLHRMHVSQLLARVLNEIK